MHKNLLSWATIKVLLLLSVLPSTAFSQIKIVSPTPRAVYQRDATGQREVNISGTFSVLSDKIEARAVPVIEGQGLPTGWKDLQVNPKGGVFSGNLLLFQGWYTVEVRATQKGIVVGRDVLERLGVGEVFIIAGQSNAQGLKAYKGAPGAQDDRVVYISNYINDSKDLLTDPPRAGFSKLTDDVTFVGPRGQTPWCWGMVGDKLVENLNVPVLFINTAWEGSAVENWFQSSLGNVTYNYYGGIGNPDAKFPPFMPYANLKVAAKTYANQYGVRAILWTQGEADAIYHSTAKFYRENLQNLINKLGADIGGKRITWVISRTSRTTDSQTPNIPVISPDVIAAQNAVIETPFNATYPGPETDQYANRGDGTHFVGKSYDDAAGTKAALTVLANAWLQTLNINFFSTVPPLAPAVVPPLTAACVTENNAVTITLPEGFASYIWSTGETSRTIRVTKAGTYYATVKDNAGNSTITSTAVLTADAKPAQPVILPQGLQQACADSGMIFSTTGSDIYNWYKDAGTTAVASGSLVNVKESGSYTVRAQNIFGCISDNSTPSSLTVQPKISKPVIESSGPFSITASITETGVNAKYRWHRPGFESDTITDIVKILKTGTYTTRAQIAYTLGNNVLTCYSDTTSRYYVTVEQNDVVFYPNPSVGDYIYIESRDNIANATITVYDIMGRVLTTELIPLLNSRVPIKIRNLPPGKFIVRVTGQGLTLTKQIVVR
jgi:hypothetical protein